MINRIDAHDHTALLTWYTTMREAAVADREEAAVMTFQDLRGMVGTPRRDRAFRLFTATEEGRVAGTLLVDLPLEENRHLAEVDINVLPELRRRGHGRRLAEHAERVMAEEGRTTATGEVYVPAGWTPQTWPGARFADALGFRTAHEEDYQVLDLPADPHVLASVPAPSDGYDLVTWSGPCPEELVAAYARMRTAMAEDVPSGELDAEPEVWDVARIRDEERRHRAQGTEVVVAVARADSGELAGYTVLHVPSGGAGTDDGDDVPAGDGSDDGVVYQEDTLVMRAHRGNRLGAALKERTLRVLERDHPGSTQVRTWVDPANTAMNTVNRRFGFHTRERMLAVQRVPTTVARYDAHRDGDHRGTGPGPAA